MHIGIPALLTSLIGSGINRLQPHNQQIMTPSMTDPDTSSPAEAAWGPPSDFVRPNAIVLWHGLGDNYNSLGMLRMKEIIQQLMPNTYVHSVYIDPNPTIDERRSLMGDANEEIDLVCLNLSYTPELQNGFGAIGFSQGGLFLQALIERCPNISVLTLVTFGSPHMGVLELPMCADDKDWLCKKRNELLKKQVWLDTIQKSIIPAQYFRVTGEYEEYLQHLNFLADVNNERTDTYSLEAKARFAKLRKLVLIKFTKDTTLVPKESAYFQEFDPLGNYIVDMRQTRVYKEDLIGLRELDKAGKIDFLTVEDNHMRFLDSFFVDVVSKYFVNGL